MAEKQQQQQQQQQQQEPSAAHRRSRSSSRGRDKPSVDGVSGKGKEALDKIRFQVLSDVHVEFLSNVDLYLDLLDSIKPLAPTLMLLGDIGVPASKRVLPRYTDFLYKMAERFETVLVTSGNHEYYGGTIEETDKVIEEVCAGRDNLHYLNRSSHVITSGSARVRVLGATLWSHVPDDHVRHIEGFLNDYKVIIRSPDDPKKLPLRVADTNELHAKTVAWLEGEISSARKAGERVVVVSHHAPTMQGSSAPRFLNSPGNHGFATPLEHMMGPPVEAWCFGHTHWSMDEQSKRTKMTRVLSNCRGYPFETGQVGPYRPDLVVEL